MFEISICIEIVMTELFDANSNNFDITNLKQLKLKRIPGNEIFHSLVPNIPASDLILVGQDMNSISIDEISQSTNLRTVNSNRHGRWCTENCCFKHK